MMALEAATGKPLDRVDGILKVTGRATYAADTPLDRLAHGLLVTSTIASGRIAAIDVRAAERYPGVIGVLTHVNAPRLKPPASAERALVDPKAGEPLPALQNDVIYYHGQPVAVVVAETFEQAQSAANLVKVTYQAQTAVTSFDRAAEHPQPPTQAPGAKNQKTAEYRRGDPAAAINGAAFRVAATYNIAAEHHNPMELHATVAAWDKGRLTLYDKTQWVDNVQEQAARAFGIEPKDVRVVSPFVGGAFGSSLRMWPHVLIAALAAKAVGRPVKIVLSRQQTFTIPGFRPQTRQEISLAADQDGKLLAIQHSGVSQTSTYEEFTESLLDPTRVMYQCPNVSTSYRLAAMNVNTPASMRGPGEVSGMFALESALDELAVAMKVDPVELRLRNFAAEDQDKQLPWSSNSLRQCYEQAAQKFGWEKRDAKPQSMSDGYQLIGYGMASATWPAKRLPATVRVRMSIDGSASVETAGSDIGPGTYTALTQIAADVLTLPTDKVRVLLGDSRLPKAPVQGGSMTIASIGSAVLEAAQIARRALIDLAIADSQSPLFHVAPDEIVVEQGRLTIKSKPEMTEDFTQLIRRHRKESLDVTHTTKLPEEKSEKFSSRSFGAHFVEVRVDRHLKTIRVARVVSAFAAGKIINPKTAHSQAIGGIVGGIGMALLEATHWDSRNGRIINANLADYHVPVNADIPALDSFFIEELDPNANPLGAKGLAELSIVGVAAAVANAVFHATGRRVRDLPITLDKLF